MTRLPADDVSFMGRLVEAYYAGVYTLWETFAAVLRQVTHANVDRAIGALPAELRSRFIEWAREGYDNRIDPSEFISIGGEGCAETPDEAFAAIRRWFALHRDDNR